MKTNDLNELKRLNGELEKEPNNVEKLYDRCIVFVRMEEYHKALNDIDSISKIDPTHKLANNIRPKIIYQMTLDVKVASGIPFEFNEAIQRGLRVPAPDPRTGVFGNDMAAATLLGDAFKFAEDGKYKNAIEVFNKIIQIKPDHIIALFCRGEMYQLLGDYDKAIIDYEKVEKINISNFNIEKIKKEAKRNKQMIMKEK